MPQRFIEVPYEKIDPEALRKLIEEFIEREGTFYGVSELPMDQKVDIVLRQLEEGKAVITWDLKTETSNIILKEKSKI
ncbi:YheU family protein [bacterium]|nr:YheU family protein [bacterium]